MQNTTTWWILLLCSACALFYLILCVSFVVYKNFWVRTVPKVYVLFFVYCVKLWNSGNQSEEKEEECFTSLEWKSIYALHGKENITSTRHNTYYILSLAHCVSRFLRVWNAQTHFSSLDLFIVELSNGGKKTREKKKSFLASSFLLLLAPNIGQASRKIK